MAGTYPFQTSDDMEYTLWMSELLNSHVLTVLEGVHPSDVLPHSLLSGSQKL